MGDIEAVEVLTQAKERLFECGWGKYTHRSRLDKGDTQSFCLEDSLVGERGCYTHSDEKNPRDRAARYLRQTLFGSNGQGSLWRWNDRQISAGPVLDALDAAILVAKESSV